MGINRSFANNYTGVDWFAASFLGGVRSTKMPKESLLEVIEEYLLDVRLFIRYFDYSDLEFLGFKAEIQ